MISMLSLNNIKEISFMTINQFDLHKTLSNLTLNKLFMHRILYFSI
jgi:hypothetical protein